MDGYSSQTYNLIFIGHEVFIFKGFRDGPLHGVSRRDRRAHRAAEERERLFDETVDGIGTHQSPDAKKGLSGQVVNILYYVSVLLVCVHYCGDDVALDRFLQELREVLLRYAEKPCKP